MRDRNSPPGEDICWGRNAVISLLETTPERCMKVVVSKSVQPHLMARILEICRKEHVTVQTADNAALDRLTGRESHQGIAAYTASMKLWDACDITSLTLAAPEPAMVLLCDHIQDPRNLGAAIRSAEAAGASAVMVPKRGGSLPTGTVVKTSAGAALRMPLVMVGNVSQSVRTLQEAGFWVIGLAMEARESLFKGDLPRRLAIVVGSESDGLGQAVSKACDELRKIPMRGAVGSLNASVAASLAMFEWSRNMPAWSGLTD